MHKHWLGNLIDIQGEIDELRLKVAELCWDEPFGMLTRNAFLQRCRELPRIPCRIVFIDLDDIGDLNLRYGYKEVDRRIKSIFNGFYNPKELVARWYSGDEIVVLFDDVPDVAQRMHELQLAAHTQGITFVYATGVWQVGDFSVEEIVDSLSSQVCREKTLSKKSFREGANYES